MEVTASLGAMGFWIFLAAVVVAGKWFDARKRETQQETLRRMVESGQQIDLAVVDKLISAGGGNSHPERDLKIAGIIVGFAAPGLLAFGWFLTKYNEKMLDVMLGVAVLVAFVGGGLYIAGKVYERWQNEDQS